MKANLWAFCSIDLSFLMPVSHCFHYCNFESSSINPLTLFFFLRLRWLFQVLYISTEIVQSTFSNSICKSHEHLTLDYQCSWDIAYTAPSLMFFNVVMGWNQKEKLLENSYAPCWPYYNIAIMKWREWSNVKTERQLKKE